MAINAVTINKAADLNSGVITVPSATTAGTVAITCRAVDRGTTDNHPVSTGVCFPKGALVSLNELRLEDSVPTEVTAQFNTLATWTDGSIKSVFVTWMAPISSGGALSYTLHYGGGVTRTATTDMTVTNTASTLTIECDTHEHTLDKTGFNLAGAVAIDTDDNGSFDKSVLSTESLLLSDLVSAADYTSGNGTFSYEVLMTGPLMTRVYITGNLSDGSTTLGKIAAEVVFYKESELVDVDLCVYDDTTETSGVNDPGPGLSFSRLFDGGNLYMSSDEYSYSMNYGFTPTNYSFGGESAASYTGTISGTNYIHQSGDVILTNAQPRVNGTDLASHTAGYPRSYSGAGTGDAAPGWMMVDDGAEAISVFAREFEYKYPSEISTTSSVGKYEMHPSRNAGTNTTFKKQIDWTENHIYDNFYWFVVGKAKTYEFRLWFHQDVPTTANLHTMNTLYQEEHIRRIAHPDPAHTGSSDIFNFTGAQNTEETNLDDSLVTAIQNLLASDRYKGIFSPLGWYHYGDSIYGSYDTSTSERS